jgi:hypothetical protein
MDTAVVMAGGTAVVMAAALVAVAGVVAAAGMAAADIANRSQAD